MEQKRQGKTPPAGGETRQERLKAALKANMARRKAQARARAGRDAAGGTGGDDTTDGIGSRADNND